MIGGTRLLIGLSLLSDGWQTGKPGDYGFASVNRQYVRATPLSMLFDLIGNPGARGEGTS